MQLTTKMNGYFYQQWQLVFQFTFIGCGLSFGEKIRFWCWLMKSVRISLNDENEFTYINNKLKKLMDLFRCFLFIIRIGFVFCVILFPILNKNRLVFNIALPLRTCSSEIVIWMSFGVIAGGLLLAVFGCFFTITLWYLMLSFVLKWKILGNQIRNMGKRKATSKKIGYHCKRSIVRQQKFYRDDFIAAIQAYDKING